MDHKARRVKQERKDPQARRASEERQGYRDHQAPRDRLVLPVLPVQQVLRV